MESPPGDRKTEAHVRDRPGAPLLVFDGDCGFCRMWVERWRRITGDRVEYRPSREVAGRFPEIGPEGFAAKVWLIEPDGRALGGARAVFRLYELAGEHRWLARAYEASPNFAAASEAAYDLVARHRDAAATATHWLWGDISERPRYRRMRSILLRALGAIYVMAFGSLAVQAEGLIGSRGILPAEEYLRLVRLALGPSAYWQLPTLLWLDASDRAILGLCWGGVALGLLLVAGILPGVCLALLWLGYLSLTVAGQEFLSYQWDSLLLEAGLLALLLTPWGLRLDAARREPSRLSVWLYRWLAFRVMFLSGVVKLASGDKAWAAWQAMKYHYETQPIPTWTSWSMHQLPPWFHSMSVGFMFWAELVAPFLAFAPRRPRMIGFWSMVLLQILILATGNFGFFNLLTIVIGLSLVEDRDWGRRREAPPPIDVERSGWPRRLLIGAIGAAVVLVTTMEGLDRAEMAFVFPGWAEALRGGVAPFRSLNAYGLFAVMTTERPEIVVEGSLDGETWRPYHFRWKPGELDRRPRFATPHMPRLDWQMWFAALAGDCRTQRWFLRFEQRLLEGSPEVLALLRDDPFPGGRPRYLRARLYLYHFTRRGSRDWWRREEVGLFCPPLRLAVGEEIHHGGHGEDKRRRGLTGICNSPSSSSPCPSCLRGESAIPQPGGPPPRVVGCAR